MNWREPWAQEDESALAPVAPGEAKLSYTPWSKDGVFRTIEAAVVRMHRFVVDKGKGAKSFVGILVRGFSNFGQWIGPMLYSIVSTVIKLCVRGVGIGTVVGIISAMVISVVRVFSLEISDISSTIWTLAFRVVTSLAQSSPLGYVAVSEGYVAVKEILLPLARYVGSLSLNNGQVGPLSTSLTLGLGASVLLIFVKLFSLNQNSVKAVLTNIITVARHLLKPQNLSSSSTSSENFNSNGNQADAQVLLDETPSKPAPIYSPADPSNPFNPDPDYFPGVPCILLDFKQSPALTQIDGMSKLAKNGKFVNSIQKTKLFGGKRFGGVFRKIFGGKNAEEKYDIEMEESAVSWSPSDARRRKDGGILVKSLSDSGDESEYVLRRDPRKSWNRCYMSCGRLMMYSPFSGNGWKTADFGFENWKLGCLDGESDDRYISLTLEPRLYAERAVKRNLAGPSIWSNNINVRKLKNVSNLLDRAIGSKNRVTFRFPKTAESFLRLLVDEMEREQEKLELIERERRRNLVDRDTTTVRPNNNMIIRKSYQVPAGSVTFFSGLEGRVEPFRKMRYRWVFPDPESAEWRFLPSGFAAENGNIGGVNFKVLKQLNLNLNNPDVKKSFRDCELNPFCFGLELLLKEEQDSELKSEDSDLKQLYLKDFFDYGKECDSDREHAAVSGMMYGALFRALESRVGRKFLESGGVIFLKRPRMATLPDEEILKRY